jgi:hypothetical protein
MPVKSSHPPSDIGLPPHGWRSPGELTLSTYTRQWHMTAIQPHNHHPVGLLKQKMRRRTYQIPGCHAKRTSHRIAAILISLICVWDAGSVAAHAENCSVEIFFAATDHKVFAQEGRLVDAKLLRVTIRNVGRHVITLVQPGDGSESGLRTPTVSWSVRGTGGSAVLQHFGMREDNLINPLEPITFPKNMQLVLRRPEAPLRPRKLFTKNVRTTAELFTERNRQRAY